MKIEMTSEMLLFIVASLGITVGRAEDIEESRDYWMKRFDDKTEELQELHGELRKVARDNLDLREELTSYRLGETTNEV
jgi:hypothetical protein